MTFDPKKYWHERGADYVAPGEEAEKPEVQNLRNLLLDYQLFDCKNILEVGSGYGRIYKNLRFDIHVSTQYSMCDFVESMRYQCLRNTGILPDYWDGMELPYNDDEFDLVISFSVLLHVTPDKIEQIIKEHARIMNQYIFIATYFGGLDRLAPHCFEHDYKGTFEKLNLKIEDERFFQNGLRVNWLLSK